MAVELYTVIDLYQLLTYIGYWPIYGDWPISIIDILPVLVIDLYKFNVLYRLSYTNIAITPV